MNTPSRLALVAACGLAAAAPALAGPDCLVIAPGAQEEVEATVNCNDLTTAQTVLCGTPFHGSSCWDPGAGIRDTDWLKVILTEPGTITATFRSEFGGMMGFVGDENGPLPVGSSFCQQAAQITPFVSSAGDCQPLEISATLPAGTYVILVAAMLSGEPVPCGSPAGDYVLEVTTTSACGGDCNGNGTADDAEIAGSPTLDCYTPPPAGGPFATGGPDGALDACQCIGNWNRDSAVNSGDISAFLTSWLQAVQGGPAVDPDCSGSTNSGDISAWLGSWLTSVTSPPSYYDCP